jgi:hypothetical protein
MEFLDTILGYPVVLYTILLGVTLVYWILAIIGLVDVDGGDAGIEVDVDADVDVDAGDAADMGGAGRHVALDGEAHGEGHASVLASYLVAMGLNGVPFSVVVSLVTLFAWVISAIAAIWILPYVPTSFLRFVVGSGVLAAAFLLALPPAALLVRPLRKIFVAHTAISNASLVGMSCKVLTGTVDEKFGRAEVPDRGAGYHIRVVADTPNTLVRGSVARIVEYDEAAMLYRIRESESP